MSREKYNELFLKNVNFLTNEIKNNNNIICLTHHLPSAELIHEKYKNYPNFMFANDLNYLIKDNIKLWMCGHSHTCNTKIINNVICTLNPFGYPHENSDESCLNKTVEL
jgi:Icc-related predicted phosphoesterase